MPKKLLLICCYEPKKYSMIVNHIESIQQKSCYTIDVFNTFNKRLSKTNAFFYKRHYPNKLNLSNYDGYIIHNTLSYTINSVLKVSNFFSPSLEEFKGIKVLMKQDETVRTNETLNLLKEWDFDLYLTCIPKDQWDIHFKNKVPAKLKIMHTLTSYVEDRMKTFNFPPIEQRPLDIFYRGMLLPYFFGKLSYEKFFIGQEFKKVCVEKHLSCDISHRHADRLHGDAWFKALGSAKAVLATESGSSVFDWDGTLEKQVSDYMGLTTHEIDDIPSISFDYVWEKFLKDHDGIVNYAQISPRHFEAASTKTVQIMFEGNYSGIFKPDIHYIPLKKDFSNIDDVIRKFKDLGVVKPMVDRAFEDIILNQDYTYDKFVEDFDKTISSMII